LVKFAEDEENHMIKQIDDTVVEALVALNNKSPLAQKAFGWMKGRQRDAERTTIDHLADRLDSPRDEVIQLARELEEAGVCEFVLGRRGAKSRILWDFGMRSIGEAANGKTSKLQRVDPEADEKAENWIEHKYQLRPEIAVVFELPRDISKSETERLANFIRTLSFEQ
jgi:hypothetical protein